MKKKYKIFLSSITLLSIAAITTTSVISCGNGSNNLTNKDTSTQKKNSATSSNSNSSGSSNNGNSSSNNSTPLTTQQVVNDVANYFSSSNNQNSLLTYLIAKQYLIYENQNISSNNIKLLNKNNLELNTTINGNYNLTYDPNYDSLNSALTDGLQSFLTYFPIDNISLTKTQISSLQIENDSNSKFLSSFIITINNSSEKATPSQSIQVSDSVIDNSISNINNLPNSIISFLTSQEGQQALINQFLMYGLISKNNNDKWVFNYSNFFSTTNLGYYIEYTLASNYRYNNSWKYIFVKNILSGFYVVRGSIPIIQTSDLKFDSTSNSLNCNIIFNIDKNNYIKNFSLTIPNNINTVANNFFSSYLNGLENYLTNSNTNAFFLDFLISTEILSYNSKSKEWIINRSFFESNRSILSQIIDSIPIKINNVFYNFFTIRISNSWFTTNLNIKNNILTFGFKTPFTEKQITVNIDLSNLYSNIQSYISSLYNEMQTINFQDSLNNFLIGYNNKSFTNAQMNLKIENSILSFLTVYFFESSSLSLDDVYLLNIYGNFLPENYWFYYWLIYSNNKDFFKIQGSINNNKQEWTLTSISIGGIGYSFDKEIIFNISNSNNKYQIIANDITTYLNKSSNQTSFLGYLMKQNYIVFSDNTWEPGSGYNSMQEAIAEGISSYWFNDINGSLEPTYDNIPEITISNFGYSNNAFTFTIQCSNINASKNTTIIYSSTKYQTIANNLTDYFNNLNNQNLLLNYLVKSGLIQYSNENSVWLINTQVNNESFNTAIQNYLTFSNDVTMINPILVYNSNFKKENNNYMLTFNIQYAGVSASEEVSISYNSSDLTEIAQTIANNLTNFLNNPIGATALLNYLISNGYIVFSNNTWEPTSNYNSLQKAIAAAVPSYLNSAFPLSNGYPVTQPITITNFSDTNNTLTFNIQYAGVSASEEVSITL